MPVYSDINQTTPETKPLLIDIESVYQSINNILNTNLGERLFNPGFGSELESMLFEIMNNSTANRILNGTIRAINKWDPRIRFDRSQSKITPNYDENRYDVVLAFSVIGVDSTNFKYEGSLLRG